MIIAIEGGVGAGKTTLLKNLSKAPSVVTMPEYFDIIPSEEHDYILSLSKREQLDIFLDIEKQRLSALNDSYCQETLYILDRSFLSLLSFQHAIGQLHTLPSFIFTANHMFNNFILPDAVLHLDVDYELRKERVGQRDHDVSSVLLEVDFVRRTRDFLDAVGSSVSYKRIDTTQISPEEVLLQALAFINKCEPATNLQLSQFSASVTRFTQSASAGWRPEI